SQRLPGTGYANQSAQGRLRVKLSPRQQLSLGYFHTQQENLDRAGSRAGDSLASVPARTQQLAYLRWQQFHENPWLHEVSVTASWQGLGLESSDLRQGTDARQFDQTSLNTLGMALTVHSHPNPYWHVVSGVEYYQDQASHAARVQPVAGGSEMEIRGWLPHQATATHLAAFTDHTLDILKLRLHLGGRAQGLGIQIPADERFEDVNLSPLGFSGQLGGLYPLHPHWHLVTSFQTGFRPPNLHDLGAFGPFSLGMAVPTDSLRPEHSLNAEIGLKMQRQRMNASLMFFRTRLSDMIDWVEGTFEGQATLDGLPVYRRENAGEALVQGVEASLDLDILPVLNLQGSLSYVEGKYLGQDERMRRMPPLNGRLALHYASRRGIWSRLVWQYALQQDQISVADRIDPAIAPLGTAGWQVFHLSLGYDLPWGSLSVGMQNVFDTYYLRHGSVLPEPGRSVQLSVQVRF
ncbi:MAG: TonB-dependent receptor, partial [Bacteroidetes bacterium]